MKIMAGKRTSSSMKNSHGSLDGGSRGESPRRVASRPKGAAAIREKNLGFGAAGGLKRSAMFDASSEIDPRPHDSSSGSDQDSGDEDGTELLAKRRGLNRSFLLAAQRALDRDEAAPLEQLLFPQYTKHAEEIKEAQSTGAARRAKLASMPPLNFSHIVGVPMNKTLLTFSFGKSDEAPAPPSASAIQPAGSEMSITSSPAKSNAVSTKNKSPTKAEPSEVTAASTFGIPKNYRFGAPLPGETEQFFSIEKALAGPSVGWTPSVPVFTAPTGTEKASSTQSVIDLQTSDVSGSDSKSKQEDKPAFSFGNVSSSNDASSSKPAFSFGTTGFGISAENAKNPFSFEAPPADAKSQFSFGESAGAPSNVGDIRSRFAFGNSAPGAEAVASTDASADKKSLFAFGTAGPFGGQDGQKSGFPMFSGAQFGASGSSGQFTFNPVPAADKNAQESANESSGEDEEEVAARAKAAAADMERMRRGPGEENETSVVEERAKLYQMESDGSWKDLGIGWFKVNESSSDTPGGAVRSRLLFRDAAVGKIFLNAWLSSKGAVALAPSSGKRDLSLTIFNNEGRMVKYAVRMREEASISAAHAIITAALSRP